MTTKNELNTKFEYFSIQILNTLYSNNNKNKYGNNTGLYKIISNI